MDVSLEIKGVFKSWKNSLFVTILGPKCPLKPTELEMMVGILNSTGIHVWDNEWYLNLAVT